MMSTEPLPPRRSKTWIVALVVVLALVLLAVPVLCFCGGAALLPVSWYGREVPAPITAPTPSPLPPPK